MTKPLGRRLHTGRIKRDSSTSRCKQPQEMAVELVEAWWSHGSIDGDNQRSEDAINLSPKNARRGGGDTARGVCSADAGAGRITLTLLMG